MKGRYKLIQNRRMEHRIITYTTNRKRNKDTVERGFRGMKAS
jgi:hypothetical protein